MYETWTISIVSVWDIYILYCQCMGRVHSPLSVYGTCAFSIVSVWDMCIHHWVCMGHVHSALSVWDMCMLLCVYGTFAFCFECMGHVHSPLWVYGTCTFFTVSVWDMYIFHCECVGHVHSALYVKWNRKGLLIKTLKLCNVSVINCLNSRDIYTCTINL